MYIVKTTSRFNKDVKTCKRKHWDLDALKRLITDLVASDQTDLPSKYKDHALSGDLKGFRSIHVDSSSNPPKGTWVVLYEISGNEMHLLRTGTHQDVYGKA